MAKADLTAQRLRELLAYDPETGEFTWLEVKGKARVGMVASYVNRHGYPEICIDGRSYRAHRLAWLFVHGEFPGGCIDHIDGNTLNFAIANLRVVDHRVNMQNVRRPRSNNKSGFLGVCLCKRSNRWIASIGHNGRVKRIGRFDTPEEAHAAYLQMKRKIHEGCTI